MLSPGDEARSAGELTTTSGKAASVLVEVPEVSAAEMVFIALGEPDDEELSGIVGRCKVPSRLPWRGRSEELGSLLVLLEPYADRPSLGDALLELLAEIGVNSSRLSAGS